MGVPGLWEIINKASQTRSVANLAVVDGFEKNEHGTRSLRVGIDASLWLQHASTPQWLRNKNPNTGGNRVGDNPELRTLFFKLCRWSKLPVTLLFMFDGRERPKVKRGSRMGKSGSHPHARGFKEMIELFGWDWREARGEAEAELAFLNQVGAIDGVLTDDIDCLIFRARVILKNFSLNLSGNKAEPPRDANGKNSEHHARVYTADEIQRHPDVKLTRGGLILFALMSGGDYDDGLFRCGLSMAHAMARQRFGDDLIAAYEQHGGEGPRFVLWLEQRRRALQTAIRANSGGLMARAALNFVIPPEWPKLSTIALYVRPLTSASAAGGGNGGDGGGPPRSRRPFDLPGLAWWCERHFEEWGYKSALLKRFHLQLTQGLVVHADRREAEKDRQGARPGAGSVRGPLRPPPHQGVGTCAGLVRACLAPQARGGGYAAQRSIDMEALRPAFVRPDTPEREDRNGNVDAAAGADMEHVQPEDAHPLVVEIMRTREHVSTDNLLEFRVKVCPRQIISIAESGVRGVHPEPGPRKRAVKFPEDEPDDTDAEGDEDEHEGGGNGKRKKKRGKKTDLNDDVLLWIPATIMKQVHPALVRDWEQRKHGGRRAGGGNANPASASRQRVAAAAIPIPQPAAPRVQINRQAVSQALVPQAGPVPPPAAAPPPQPAPPAPQRAGRGKGKARARPHDEYDYLAVNPYASAAPPRHDFNPMTDTSFPFRVCGFMFTWPDPDDPDRLIVDTEERDDLPTMVDYREVESAGVFGEYGPPAGASQGVPRTQARARAPATSSVRRSAAEAPSAHPSASASRSDDTAVGTSVDDSLATIVAAASASGASKNQSQRNAASSRKRKGADYHGSQIGDDDLGPWIEPEDGGRNRYALHASEIDRLLGIGANGEPVPIPKRKGRTRGRQIRAPEPPPPPTTTSASAERERHDGKGKERADRECSKTKRRKTVHEDVFQPTPSSPAPGPSLNVHMGVSASTFRKHAEPLFFESDSGSGSLRSPSPFNALRSSSPALPPPSSSFPTPSTSRSLARNIPLPPSSSPCGRKQRGPDLDVISISSDSEDEPIADQLDLTLSGDDWLRNIAPFNGTPSAYSQRKARETVTQLQSVRTAPADMNVDSDAEHDDAMVLNLVLESARDSHSKTLVAGEACRQAFASSTSTAQRPYHGRSVPLRSSYRNNALEGNADGDTSGAFFRDATEVRRLR